MDEFPNLVTSMRELEEAKRQRDIMLPIVAALMMQPNAGKMRTVSFSQDYLETFAGVVINIDSSPERVTIEIETSIGGNGVVPG